jgi:HAD superfamily hydrolase (TIGR01509 family)
MPIRAVVFDLDGLMFNTEAIYDKVGEALLLRRGKIMTPELKLAMIGRRAQESLTIMIDMHGLHDTVDDLILESHEMFFEAAAGRLAPMPGLHDLLEYIDSNNLPKALATSSSRNYVERVIGPFGMLPRFPVILASEDVTLGKPHPEIYLKAADRLGIAPTEMMVLEDSQNGVNAAASAGAIAVAVPHEHTFHHDFSRATLIAESLHDPRVLSILRHGIVVT